MKRLTYSLGKTIKTYGLEDRASARAGLFTDYDGFYAYLLATHKLGQYEDTGLGPEEIKQLQAELEKAMAELVELKGRG